MDSARLRRPSLTIARQTQGVALAFLILAGIPGAAPAQPSPAGSWRCAWTKAGRPANRTSDDIVFVFNHRFDQPAIREVS